MSGGEIFAAGVLVFMAAGGWFCVFMAIRTKRCIRRLGELRAHDLARDTKRRT
jgi:hypothetical protein